MITMESGSTVISDEFFKNDSIMIFGGAGSLGHTLVKKYLPISKNIFVVSRDEAKHWELHNHINFSFPNTKNRLKTLIGDVRDLDRLVELINQCKPDTVIIAQALKQVDVCESYPEESIKTNILGVNNTIKAIEQHNSLGNHIVKNVCFVSTDKACNPINVYGMCKRISEKLILSVSKTSKSKYVITRYGNVLSSKGSIVPLFQKQALDSNCPHFTLTDINMTRFLMTLDESVELIDKALKQGNPGDIWVPKLKAIKIIDLANYFSSKFNKPIKIVGIRPGEKLHESLLSEEESAKAKVVDECFVVNDEVSVTELKDSYSSHASTLVFDELKEYMDKFVSLY